MLKFASPLFILLCLGLSTLAQAMPAQIVLIRHGEKPDEGRELSTRGWLRARSLPTWFDQTPLINRFGPPAAIYAVDPKNDDSSIRMIQTVTPLAQRFGLKILHPVHRNASDDLQEEIASHPEYAGKTVIVCWHRDGLVDLAESLGLEDIPDKWPKKAFDRAWVLEYSRSGKKVRKFYDTPQNILPGDSDH